MDARSSHRSGYQKLGRRARSEEGIRERSGGFSDKQRMRSTPPLQSSNRYACLEVEEYIDNSPDMPELPVVQKKSTEPKTRRQKWERTLPKEFHLASTSGNRSLQLEVQLQTTDTREEKSTTALLDCGATGLFINEEYVEREGINTKRLSTPTPVYNVDGTPNKAGPITHVADLILRYKGHEERTTFAVTKTGTDNIILGIPWLKEHNPEVNWVMEEIQMSRCPSRCRTCLNEETKEKKAKEELREKIAQCQTGPML